MRASRRGCCPNRSQFNRLRYTPKATLVLSLVTDALDQLIDGRVELMSVLASKLRSACTSPANYARTAIGAPMKLFPANSAADFTYPRKPAQSQVVTNYQDVARSNLQMVRHQTVVAI